MAVIHNTTLRPGKLELLAAWLPAQPWYRGTGREPELARAGGFRLDDPEGEVGIEFMVVTDGPGGIAGAEAGDGAASYQVPLSYRSGPLAGAEGGLIGTAAHGVLGRRWVYDGVHDPVVAAQLVALIQGTAQAQAQSVSDTADPTVTSQPIVPGPLTPLRSAVVANAPSGTDLQVETGGPDGGPPGQLVLRIHRVLVPGGMGTAGRPGAAAAELPGGQPCLSATWRQPDGTAARGVFATGWYSAGRIAV